VATRRLLVRLLTFVGGILLVAMLASLASSTWATPAQNDDTWNNTIPDKYSNKSLVGRGESAEFQILVNHPITATDTWYSTVVTDTVDANLQITGLGTTQGSASWTGQDVTFTIGTILPGEWETLKIYVRVNDDAPSGYPVTNTAYMYHTGWVWVASEPKAWMFCVAYQQYMPLSMKRFP
jgi:hypothetical protein